MGVEKFASDAQGYRGWCDARYIYNRFTNRINRVIPNDFHIFINATIDKESHNRQVEGSSPSRPTIYSPSRRCRFLNNYFLEML